MQTQAKAAILRSQFSRAEQSLNARGCSGCVLVLVLRMKRWLWCTGCSLEERVTREMRRRCYNVDGTSKSQARIDAFRCGACDATRSRTLRIAGQDVPVERRERTTAGGPLGREPDDVAVRCDDRRRRW